MTITIKRTRSAMTATALGASGPYLDLRARSERTNKVMQALRESVPLRSCSIAARGLWIEMVSIMKDCEPYGYLLVNGAPMNVHQLARLVGENSDQVNELLTELWRAGVFGCKGKCIYSPEMAEPDEQGESK